MSKNYTVVQLTKICKEKGIKGYSKLNKAQLMKQCLDSKTPVKKTPKSKTPAKKTPLRKTPKSKKPAMDDLPSELEGIITGMKKDMEYVEEVEAEKDRLLKRSKGSWLKISKSYDLSEKFMRVYSKKLNWTQISMQQKLSRKFLNDYKNKIDWKLFASYNKYITPEILQAFPGKINRIRVKNNTAVSPTVYNYVVQNRW